MAEGIVHDNSTPERGYKLPDPENVPHSDVLRIAEALDAIDGDVAGLLLALARKVEQDALVTLKNEILGGAGPAIDTLRELADKDAADVAGLMALIGQKAPASHSHDDRYYTESQINSRLAQKANSSHGHSIASIAGLQAALDAAGGSLTQADLDNLKNTILGGAGPAIDTLKELADKDAADIAGLTALIGQKAPVSHSHDNRYYTESEMNAKLAQKANVSHSHAIGNISGLQAALNAKAASNHAHSIGNVSGLQSALNSKAGSSHSHTIASVTGLSQALADAGGANYQGTNASETNYPVGTLLLATGYSSYNYRQRHYTYSYYDINALVSPRVKDRSFYVYDFTDSIALAGVWRCRCTYGNTAILIQRVA